MCCQLAHTLSSRGYGVGVLDVDICGPSVARMLGVGGRTVHKSGSGWMPVYANPNLSVMSISFLLGDDDAAGEYYMMMVFTSWWTCSND